MTEKNRVIAEFWQVFQQHGAELAACLSADNPIYDLLLEQLQNISPRLFFEFSANPRASELIITADGDRSLFGLVESIVAAAPTIPGWSVVALKPKLGFPVTTTWEGIKIAIADVVFEPLDAGNLKGLGIRIFVPGITPESAEDAHNAILRAIDHGLGEREFAESVQHTEVLPLPNAASAEACLPLTALEDFINWRKRRREAGTDQQDDAAHAE